MTGSKSKSLRRMVDALMLAFLGVDVKGDTTEDNEGKMLVSFTVPNKSDITAEAVIRCMDENQYLNMASITREELLEIGSEIQTSVGIAKVAKKLLSFDIFDEIRDDYKENFGRDFDRELEDSEVMEFMSTIIRCFYAPRDEVWTIDQGMSEMNTIIDQVEKASKYVEI